MRRIVINQLTPNFSRSELLFSATAARKGLSNEPESPEIEANLIFTANYLQKLRDKLNKPVRVLSCYRSPRVNRAVGGSRSSAHMKALAVDLIVPGMSVKAVCKYIRDNFEYDQIIYEFGEGGWVHWGMPTKNSRKQLLTASRVNGRTVYKTGFA